MSRTRALALACAMLLGACATPAARLEQTARDLGLQVGEVRGNGFAHALYVKPDTTRAAPPQELHVYLDGDGRPTVAGLPTHDPTPRDPLVLRLMALDPAGAIYLGRPCYHGRGPAADCAPALWTGARYGEQVVASLATALQRYPGARGKRIVWFGYSGGGALAMLLAERFPQTIAVVTVAANLDVAAWARHHGRLPPADSLNPAARPPLPPDIVQRHYFGSADRVVPPGALPRSTMPGADWIEVSGFDHACCWTALWPRVLAEVTEAIAQSRKLNPSTAE